MCGAWVTAQMYNQVTNQSEMFISSKRVFEEKSYSSLHSGQSLAWDHFRSIIADACGNWRSRGADAAIEDSAGVDDDYCMTN